MKRFISSLIVVWFGVWAGACGSAGAPAPGAARGSLSSAVDETGNTTIAFGLAHGASGLKGDEDDDDNESHTEGADPKGDSDNDMDNDTVDNAQLGFYDKDDSVTTARGHPADAHDARLLVSVVERYYQAAAAANGARACASMAPAFARTIPGTYGRAPGPAYLRGATTCAAVMSRLFGRERRLWKSPRRVIDVRLDRGEAFVLLGSPTAPASIVMLMRVGGGWKLAGMGGGPLP